MTDLNRPHIHDDGSFNRPGHAATAAEDAHTILINKVSWGAIFSGVAVALVVQVLLTMLGVGIGIATLDPATGDNPAASTFSITAGIWYVLSGIIASFIGGYIAARLSGKTVATTGALHGLTTWAVTTLLVLYFLTSTVGSLIGGAFSGVTSAIGGLGQTVAQTAAPALANSNPLDAFEGQVRAAGADPEALQARAVNALRALATSDEQGAEQARQQAAQALSEARGIPLDQAQQQVQQIEAQYRQTVDQAREAATQAADTAASVASTGAILAFIALVLGAVAGWLGGRSGVVHPVYADRLIPSRRVVEARDVRGTGGSL
ncbi:PhnA-like protein [Antarcticirhabdus aurantiaca]|uniref:PhnA-like protein n=1 Tax=Antarcticirhabdus aurantiaca TaxID=2606717 RepID=A0ACD4NWU0_9HYPH|nr:PhnA-like protein [Jeongeuplla avenae]